MLGFQDVRLESGELVDPMQVQSSLAVGQIIETKVDQVSPLILSIDVQREDAKRYIMENRIISKYGMFDLQSFRVLLTEDFQIKATNIEDLKKRVNVKFPRMTNNPHFRNWDIFEIRQEFQLNDSLNYLFKPHTERLIQLVWRLHGGLLVEEEIEELTNEGINGKLKLRGIEYDGINAIGRDFVPKIRAWAQQISEHKYFTNTSEKSEIESMLRSKMQAKQKPVHLMVSFSKEKPRKALLSSLRGIRFSQELININKEFLSFHDSRFYHIEELLAWTKGSIDSQEYQQYMDDHQELIVPDEPIVQEIDTTHTYHHYLGKRDEDEYISSRQPIDREFSGRGNRGDGEFNRRDRDRDHDGGFKSKRDRDTMQEDFSSWQRRESPVGRSESAAWAVSKPDPDAPSWGNTNAQNDTAADAWAKDELPAQPKDSWGQPSSSVQNTDWQKIENSTAANELNKAEDKPAQTFTSPTQPAAWGNVTQSEETGGWDKQPSKVVEETTSAWTSTPVQSNNDERENNTWANSSNDENRGRFSGHRGGFRGDGERRGRGRGDRGRGDTGRGNFRGGYRGGRNNDSSSGVSSPNTRNQNSSWGGSTTSWNQTNTNTNWGSNKTPDENQNNQQPTWGTAANQRSDTETGGWSKPQTNDTALNTNSEWGSHNGTKQNSDGWGSKPQTSDQNSTWDKKPNTSSINNQPSWGTATNQIAETNQSDWTKGESSTTNKTGWGRVEPVEPSKPDSWTQKPTEPKTQPGDGSWGWSGPSEPKQPVKPEQPKPTPATTSSTGMVETSHSEPPGEKRTYKRRRD